MFDFSIFCVPVSLSLALSVASLSIIADNGGNDTVGFVSSSLSSINVTSGATLEIVAATIDTAGNITGDGDVSLACSTASCEMAFGSDSNVYGSTSPYHLSNSELLTLQSTGVLVFGSTGSRNVSQMRMDDFSATFSASSVKFASSAGSISTLNRSNELTLCASSAVLSFEATGNVSLGTDLSISMTSGGVVDVKAEGELTLWLLDLNNYSAFAGTVLKDRVGNVDTFALFISEVQIVR